MHDIKKNSFAEWADRQYTNARTSTKRAGQRIREKSSTALKSASYSLNGAEKRIFAAAQSAIGNAKEAADRFRAYVRSSEFEAKIDELLELAKIADDAESPSDSPIEREQRIRQKLQKLGQHYAFHITTSMEIGGAAGIYLGPKGYVVGQAIGATVQVVIIIEQVVYVFNQNPDGDLIPVI